MHRFLKAIGFQNVTSEKVWNRFLNNMEEDFTEYERINIEEELDFCELRKECGTSIGIRMYGQVNEFEQFSREFYLPYFEGQGVSTYADIMVEKRSDRDSFIGVCEDAKVGVTLIFHLLNGIEYMKEYEGGSLGKASTSVTFSGLALNGKVLLPIKKDMEKQQEYKRESRNRMLLLSAAREGDADAIENLTLEDMDTYSEVARRIRNEDIYSIVDTYFRPYGVECDQYSVLGEIVDMDIVENRLTKEEIYILRLDVNELQFDVCIPMKRLIGEPEIGRRLKADIWLQGIINFQHD